MEREGRGCEGCVRYGGGGGCGIQLEVPGAGIGFCFQQTNGETDVGGWVQGHESTRSGGAMGGRHEVRSGVGTRVHTGTKTQVEKEFERGDFFLVARRGCIWHPIAVGW